MSRSGRSLGGRVEAVAGVLRAPQLRRLQLAWGAFFLFDGISLVALSVWAFANDGASAVGLVGLARLLPGAIALPFGAWAADRFPRRRVVGLVFSAITVVQALIAVALATAAPATIVYVLVGLNSVAAAPYRPAHLALAPLVARSPQELVAMNVTAGTVEGLVTFLGPAVAALVLLGADPWVVVTVAAGAALMGLLAVARLNVEIDPSKAVRRSRDRPGDALLGGIRELAANPDMAAVVGCFIIQLLVRGLLNVLLVSVSFDLIDLDSSGVGWLAASMGIGGIAGGVYAVSLTGRRKLTAPFALALILWGAPIAVIGIVPSTGVALAALFAVGLGNALLDVSGFTLIQRLGSDRALGRVFGVMFTFGIAFGGLGSLAAPPLVRWLGLRPMLMIVGLILPALTVLLLRRFRSIDQRSEPLPDLLALLAASPLLSPLPPTTLEKLAARSRLMVSGPGATIVAEGDHGDLFYLIAEGEVGVFRSGTHHNTLGPGDQFGEIALLHGVTRTATIVTTQPTRLVAIDGTDFVDALSSSDAAFAAGTNVAAGHLAHDR
ncbi:MAG TPA: MFS transporter [Ilumatobacteraceae bacterium]|jgi:MFS family permease